MGNPSKRRRQERRRGRGSDDLPLESLYFDEPPTTSPDVVWQPDTKSLQLCRQVQLRLDLALAELDDPVLEGLWVHAVLPEPRGVVLRVLVVAADDGDPDRVTCALERARGRLRRDVAAAIHRKRTPQLVFQVLLESALRDLWDEDEVQDDD